MENSSFFFCGSQTLFLLLCLFHPCITHYTTNFSGSNALCSLVYYPWATVDGTVTRSSPVECSQTKNMMFMKKKVPPVFPHPVMQWAAVITHSSEIRDPAQTANLSVFKLTCQGQLPGRASWPPTILLLFTARPHSWQRRKELKHGVQKNLIA